MGIKIKELMTKHEKLTKIYKRLGRKYDKIMDEWASSTRDQSTPLFRKKQKQLVILNLEWDNLIENHKKIDLLTRNLSDFKMPSLHIN